jgi:hypothetical protein
MFARPIVAFFARLYRGLVPVLSQQHRASATIPAPLSQSSHADAQSPFRVAPVFDAVTLQTDCRHRAERGCAQRQLARL